MTWPTATVLGGGAAWPHSRGYDPNVNRLGLGFVPLIVLSM